MSIHVNSCPFIPFDIELFRKFSKVGEGGEGGQGSNMSSNAFGDSFAVWPKAKMQHAATKKIHYYHCKYK
jgi:hypothetical protein